MALPDQLLPGTSTFANNHYSGHAPAALELFETAFTKHAVARTAP